MKREYAMEVRPAVGEALFELTRDERLWGALAEFLSARRDLARDQMERGETEAQWREAKGAAKLAATLLQLPDVTAQWRQGRQPDIGAG